MIGSREVRGSDGSTWTIERHWAPRPRWWRSFKDRVRRRRERRKDEDSGWDWSDLFRLDGGDDLEGFLVFVAAIIVLGGIVLAVLFGWPLLVFVFDTLLFIPLVLLTVLSRVLFRRPWTLEARTSPALGGSRSVVWKVTGWRASSEALRRMEQMIRSRGEPSDGPPQSPAAHRRARR